MLNPERYILIAEDDEFVYKPFEIEDFVTTVRRYFVRAEQCELVFSQ